MDLNTGDPLDTLAPLAKQAIELLGSRCTTVSGVIDSKDRAVFSAITEGLERANKHATSNAQKVTYALYTTYVCDISPGALCYSMHYFMKPPNVKALKCNLFSIQCFICQSALYFPFNLRTNHNQETQPISAAKTN